MRARSLGMATALLAVTVCACPGAPKLPVHGRASEKNFVACEKGRDCSRTEALLGSISAFTNVKHDFLLDPTSALVPGRGVTKADGAFTLSTTACARPQAHASDGGKIDPTAIDFGFVGVAVDSTLVGADADLTSYFGAGGSAEVRKIRLVALAFVRDLDPQFFEATDDVSYQGSACACGQSSHFVGAVKYGGMLSYEVEARAGEVHANALSFLKAKLLAKDAVVNETRIGGLEVEGLDAVASGNGEAKALSFRVKNPVPVAYSVYPVADVCRFSFPEPEVTPMPVDFGDVPYGREETRLLHLVNRSRFDVTASFRGKLFAVPAHGSLDLQTRWAPLGETVGCEPLAREDSIVFTPRDANTPVTPPSQTVRIVEHVRTGKAALTFREHIDTGEARSPNYGAAARDVACPADYVVASCRADNAACGDGACTSSGYGVIATPQGSGCHFGCTGPSSLLFGTHYCRFDAITECRIRCAK